MVGVGGWKGGVHNKRTLYTVYVCVCKYLFFIHYTHIEIVLDAF